jgi:hypothetical protein
MIEVRVVWLKLLPRKFRKGVVCDDEEASSAFRHPTTVHLMPLADCAENEASLLRTLRYLACMPVHCASHASCMRAGCCF